MSYKNNPKWQMYYNTAGGGEVGTIVANRMLLKQSEKAEFIAKSKQFRKVEFQLDNSTGDFIKKDANGDEYVDFVLTDNLPDSDGETYTPELLQRWAKEINEGKLLVGDIDHEEYDNILQTTVDKESIMQKLLNKKGIAKTVKAIYEKGKLWVKAVIDKRYKNMIRKANGVSLEAFVFDAENNVAKDGELLGFTFMVSDKQANPRAIIA
jgi:hypothetical protein